MRRFCCLLLCLLLTLSLVPARTEALEVSAAAAVLMDADIHESPEVHNIADSSFQHHARCQILHIQHITSQYRTGHLISRVTGWFFQFLYDILKRQFTNAQFSRCLLRMKHLL